MNICIWSDAIVFNLLLSLEQLSAHVFLGNIYTLMEQSEKSCAALSLAQDLLSDIH